MQEGIGLALDEMSVESVQVLTRGVARLLLDFTKARQGESAMPAYELADEVHRITQARALDNTDAQGHTDAELGFRLGVLAATACIGMLVPDAKGPLQERLRTWEQYDLSLAALGATASLLGVAPDADQPVETVYSTDLRDPDFHHPELYCPERRRIVRSGEYETCWIPYPSRRLRAQKHKGGRWYAHSIRLCLVCRVLGNIDSSEVYF